jgi:hypothetical protein
MRLVQRVRDGHFVDVTDLSDAIPDAPCADDIAEDRAEALIKLMTDVTMPYGARVVIDRALDDDIITMFPIMPRALGAPMWHVTCWHGRPYATNASPSHYIVRATLARLILTGAYSNSYVAVATRTTLERATVQNAQEYTLVDWLNAID